MNPSGGWLNGHQHRKAAIHSRSQRRGDGGAVESERAGLGEVGFVEGRNVAVAFRWAEGHYDRLPALAVELVNLPVAVLLAAGGSSSALSAKAATSTVPIVFSAVSVPVQLGLVASLNRPGGNVTGMGMFGSELWAKSVELS
jgi:putative ABC transport system substrate-binding protein